MATSPSLLRSVEASLKAADLDETDKAAAVLARRLAEEIDSYRDDPKLHSWALRWLSPLLLENLKQLGLTPLARKQPAKDGKPDDTGPRAALYELRARTDRVS
nr:hypothetical protein Hi04_10k_c361_00021 [uncultured bacterium]